MPEAERQGDHIVVTTSYTDRDLMTQLPGAKFRKNSGQWEVPLTWAACQVLRGLFQSRLQVGNGLKAWSWEEHEMRVAPSLKLRSAYELDQLDAADMSAVDLEEWLDVLDSIEAGSSLKLKAYQAIDAVFMAKAEQCLLANMMGLGKSPVTIRTLQLLDALRPWSPQQNGGTSPFPALVVCPNSLKHTVWQREFAKWAPELSVVVVGGSATQRRKALKEKAEVYIIHWDAMRLHSRLSPYGNTTLTENQKTPKELNEVGFHTVVMDEAHRLKDPTTAQTRATWAVAHQAIFRFALTGTPIADHVGDFWGILHTVRPESFPSKTRYMDRYAMTTFNVFGGVEVIGLRPDTEPEFRKITDHVYRRIPKEAALPQLPPKLPVMYRQTPLEPKQAKLYAEMEKEQLAWLDDTAGSEEPLAAPTHLAKLTRLLQFAAASATLDEAGNVRLASPSCKVNDLVDLLEEMGGDPLVVVAVSRQLVELAARKLADLGISCCLVTGAQTPEERDRAVQDFQAGRSRVILLTLGAGAEGLTLTRSDTILFMQESFRQLENDQAVGRIDRIGSEQHACLKIIKQVTPGTVEERKLQVLAGKVQRIEEVLRDRDMLKQLLGG